MAQNVVFMLQHVRTVTIRTYFRPVTTKSSWQFQWRRWGMSKQRGVQMKAIGMAIATVSLLGLISVDSRAADILPDVPNDVETSNSGLYLRADAGWSFLEWSGGDDDSSFVLGGGVGYQLNDMLRTDLTLDVSGDYEVAPGSEISTTSVLGNLYLDWANDTPLTPYVGVGAGYGWVGNNPDGFAVGLAAGVALGVTENLDVDLGYRFRDIMANGPDVMEHQATIGMRFKF
jgi:opacity protein-like surface antigen